jgi:zinc transport system substrate-binding protein
MRGHRLAALALAVILLAPGSAAAGPLRVLASFLPMYLLTINVVGDAPGVSVDLMLPANLGCPHDYALTPSDMRKIAEADLLVANGRGMEEFLGAPIRRVNPQLRVVETAATVEPLRESHGGGIHGDAAADVNPHTWVSPRNAVLQVRAIEKALSEASPRNAARFHANADGYVRRLERLDRAFSAASLSFRKRNIVTFHDVFDYLARDYGLAIVGEIESTPGQEPSAGEMQRLIRTIRERGVPAVFAEPQYPPRIAEVIAREAGVPVRVLDPAVTGSISPTAYEDVMWRNLKTLTEALAGP